MVVRTFRSGFEDSDKKAAPLLGPRFKEVKVAGCQERRWKLPTRKAGRFFGKC